MTSKRIIVVGGGAAGLLSAGKAAESGIEVMLIEKMARPGRKLRITGSGRCNLTNTLPLRQFLEHFPAGKRFLKHAFYTFFSDELIALLESIGVPTVEERGGRVFPVSQDAQDVVGALIRWNREQGVTIRKGTKVSEIITKDGAVTGVRTDENEIISGEAVIIATGGRSYPATGSTGDGYTFAEKLGHTIIPIRPALIPLETAGDYAPRMQGLSLRNVTVSLFFDGKKKMEAFGEMLFTHFGVSGPIILTMSRTVVDALRAKSEVEISIDLKPALDRKKLDARLLRDMDNHGRKQYQSLLRSLLPKLLVPIALDATGIDPEKPANQITSEERHALLSWLKDFRFRIPKHQPLSQAIVTAGGVSTSEINPQTMESKLVEGLYFAGEVMDIDAETGGFNLQAAFSTGWLAGDSAVRNLQDRG